METKVDKIASVAFTLFNQHGFKKVTMSDIAEAAAMSRPTLYAEFPNKEAVFGLLFARQRERAEAQVARELPRAKSVAAQLGVVFDAWIVEPFASVVDSPAGLDMLGNAAVYAPEPCADLYARFAEQLAAILTPAMGGAKGKTAKKSDKHAAAAMSAKDLAHILMLATKGLKASTTTLAELRRMTDGLIAMAVATAETARGHVGE